MRYLLCVLIVVLCGHLAYADGTANQKVHEFSSRVAKGPPEIQVKNLKNGLTLVVMPNHKVPVINAMLAYRVGGLDDPLGKSGLAHFLEHLMFRETKNYSDVVDAIGEHNSIFNAFTSQYITAYHHKCVKDLLPNILKIEADRMANLVISSDHANAEKKIVLEERKSRSRHPRDVLLNRMLGAFYQNNKGWNVIGWEHEIHRLNRADAMRFYKSHYSPNNAVMVLAGDIDMSKAFSLVRKYFGKIEASKAEQLRRPFLLEPPLEGDTYVDYVHEESERPELFMMFGLPPVISIPDNAVNADYSKGHSEDIVRNILTFSIANNFLGGSNGVGYLFKKLVLEDGMADSVSVEISDSHSRSVLLISAVPKPGVELKAIERLIRDALARDKLFSGDGKVSNERDLVLSKQSLGYDLAKVREDYQKLQFFYGVRIAEGLSLETINSLWSTYEQIAVSDVASKIVDAVEGGSVVGYLRAKAGGAK